MSHLSGRWWGCVGWKAFPPKNINHQSHHDTMAGSREVSSTSTHNRALKPDTTITYVCTKQTGTHTHLRRAHCGLIQPPHHVLPCPRRQQARRSSRGAWLAATGGRLRGCFGCRRHPSGRLLHAAAMLAASRSASRHGRLSCLQTPAQHIHASALPGAQSTEHAVPSTTTRTRLWCAVNGHLTSNQLLDHTCSESIPFS
jgi:hypothetical protein